MEAILPARPSRHGLPAIIKAVLQQVQWEGMRMRLSMDQLSFGVLEPLLFSARDFSSGTLAGGAWWTWPEVSNAEMPYWWNAPTEFVVGMYPALYERHTDGGGSNAATPNGESSVGDRGDGRAYICYQRRGPEVSCAQLNER